MSFIKRIVGGLFGGGPSAGDLAAQRAAADRRARERFDAERKVAEEKAAAEAKQTRRRRQGAAANIFNTGGASGLDSSSLLTAGSKLSAPL